MGLLCDQHPLQLDHCVPHFAHECFPGLHVADRAHYRREVPRIQRVPKAGRHVRTQDFEGVQDICAQVYPHQRSCQEAAGEGEQEAKVKTAQGLGLFHFVTGKTTSCDGFGISLKEMAELKAVDGILAAGSGVHYAGGFGCNLLWRTSINPCNSKFTASIIFTCVCVGSKWPKADTHTHHE